MTTGRVEYAPDYKSEKRKPKYPEMTERFKQLDQRHEQQRLEREVIEAAKAELAVWEGFHTTGWTAASASARNKLRKATRALIEFESQHGIETKD